MSERALLNTPVSMEKPGSSFSIPKSKQGIGSKPSKDYRCPNCKQLFKAPGTIRDEKMGKVCPHCETWTSTNHLFVFTRTGNLPAPRGHRRNPLTTSSAKDASAALRTFGINDPEIQALTALHWWNGAYDQLFKQLPENSVARALVEGAFGKIRLMSEQIANGRSARLSR